MVSYYTFGSWLAGVLALLLSWHSPPSPRQSLFWEPTDVPETQRVVRPTDSLSAEQEHFCFPHVQMGPLMAVVMIGTQGLPLVHFPAQPESSLPLKPRNTPNVFDK
jgi:hypothetical protein